MQNIPSDGRNASVAQWIEQCPPEACAAVRLRSDASDISREGMVNSEFAVVSRGFYILQKGAKRRKKRQLQEIQILQLPLFV